MEPLPTAEVRSEDAGAELKELDESRRLEAWFLGAAKGRVLDLASESNGAVALLERALEGPIAGEKLFCEKELLENTALEYRIVLDKICSERS